MLGADLDAFGLQDLADIEEARKVFRLGIVLEQVVVDDRVAFIVFLVRKHDGSEDAGAIFRHGEGFNGAHFGERLEAVLGDEAGVMCFVVEKGTRPCQTFQLCASPD